MQAMSRDYLRGLSGSHQRVVSVEAWRAGRRVAQALPVTSGSLTLTAGQGVESQVELQVADPDAEWVPAPESALSAWGSELVVRAGMRHGPLLDVCTLGRFVVTSASSQESYRLYQRPAEPGRDFYRSRGATVDVSASDRMVKVQEARFVQRQQPRESTVFAEVARLVRGIVPWRPPNAADHHIPRSVTYEDDRVDALQKLAALSNMTPAMTPDGALTFRPQAAGGAVWEIPPGESGVLVAFERTITRDGLYNAVVARGTTAKGRPLQAAAFEASGPLRWGGPYGRSPMFYESPVLKTQAHVKAAAATRLASVQRARQQQITVSCVCNYALQLRDVVRVPMPRGPIDGQVVSISWPLGPGDGATMDLTLSVDPFVLAGVS